MKHEDYMRMALELAARAGEEGEIPVGAVVVHEGEVIAQAGNEKERRRDATGHAELIVLQQAAGRLGRWRLFGCTLYVTMEPCPMCAGACVLSRIDRVVYGASDPKMGCAGSRMDILRDERFNHWVEVIPGVLEEECSALLTEFFSRLRARGR